MPINLPILDIFLKLDLEINKPMAFHGIGRLGEEALFQKINFLDLERVFNINGSSPIIGFSIASIINERFGHIGIVFNPELACLLGSIITDFGSDRLGSRLNPANFDFKKELQDIKKIKQNSKIFANTAEFIKVFIENRSRESMLRQTEELLQDFGELNKCLQNNDRLEFKKKYEYFAKKYSSKHSNTQQQIDKIATKINLLLEQSKISSDTKTKISQLLNQHNDFAHRVLYQTDIMDDVYGFSQYNELHFSPILQHLSGVFVAITNSKNFVTDIVMAKRLFTTLENVMETLFVPQENHTEASFNSLVLEKKESFKIFFKIEEELTFEAYKKTIDIFFTNQKRYVEFVLKNLNENLLELRQQLRTKSQNETIESLQQLLATMDPENIQQSAMLVKQIEATENQIEFFKDSVDREKSAYLLEREKRSFTLCLYDSKCNRTIKIPTDLKDIENIMKSGHITQQEKIELSLFYVLCDIINFDQAKQIIDSELLEDLDFSQKIDTTDDYKIMQEIVKRIPEITNIDAKMSFLLSLIDKNSTKERFALDDDMEEIITKAINQGDIKKLTVESLKSFCNMIVLYNSCKKNIVITAINNGIIEDFTAENLKILLLEIFPIDRFGSIYRRDVIKNSVEQDKLSLTINSLKELCSIVEDDNEKEFIIATAITQSAIIDLKNIADLQKFDEVFVSLDKEECIAKIYNAYQKKESQRKPVNTVAMKSFSRLLPDQAREL